MMIPQERFAILNVVGDTVTSSCCHHKNGKKMLHHGDQQEVDM